MGSTLFLRRLRRELPEWVEQGWVREGDAPAILGHVAARRRGAHALAYSLSLLGVLLLGSGVITWLAANWDGIPKLAKLLVLVGSLWLAYAGAAHFLRDGRSRPLGQAILLLGVILFGANIMLIAQIYHIDSHFPDGVLLWSLGGLLTAYLLHSQPALALSILLGVLWTGMESLAHGAQPHWGYLALWAASLALIHRHGWRAALQLAMLALMIWSVFLFVGLQGNAGWETRLYLLQIYFLAYLALFLGAMLISTHRRLERLAPVLQRYSSLGALASLYILTFPGLHTRGGGLAGLPAPEPATAPWIGATLVFIATVAGLAAAHRHRTRGATRPAYLRWGQALAAAVAALCVINLYLPPAYGGPVAVGLNLLFFAAVIWLVYAGVHANDRALVNLGFAFFALGLFSRYFDTFWSLLNRSFFFMGGGLILLIAGFMLERQRRRVTGTLSPGPAGAAP